MEAMTRAPQAISDGPSTSGRYNSSFRQPCVRPPRRRERAPGLKCQAAAAGPGPSSSSSSPSSSSPSSSSSSGRSLRAAAASSPAFSPDTFRDEAAARAAGAPRGMSPPAPAGAERMGVLLLNLGGPDTLEDVQPFLYNLFADPDIIRLPPTLQWVQPAIAALIAAVRAPKSREGYEAIGGGSPLRDITQHQADALGAALRARGLDAHTYVAMRYWRPFTEEAVEAIKRDGITKLVVLPLYPQFSVSTSGSSLRLLEKLLKEDPVLAQVKHVVIPSWYQRPGYVRAMADLIAAELPKFPKPEEVEVFFSAHGVPKSYVDEGDPYKEEMEHCIQLIMSELRRRGLANPHTLAYQSRVGPVEWLQPYTDDSIRHLAAQGVKSLLAVPISFVSEHIETLEEIDMEYRELAEECGIKHWARVPALNTDPTFIDDLADAVVEALPYVGTLAGSSSTSDSLVPMGEVEALLETYDSQRKVLPPPIVDWTPGWTLSAEAWNGRLAILALVLVLLLELSTGRGVITNFLAL